MQSRLLTFDISSLLEIEEVQIVLDYLQTLEGQLIAGGIVFVIVILLTLLFRRGQKRRRYQQLVKQISNEFEQLNKLPIRPRLEKIASIGAANSIFLRAYNDFQKRYDDLRQLMGRDIEKEMSQLKYLLKEKKYKFLKTQATQTQVKLVAFKDRLQEILNDLHEITRGEDENLKEMSLVQTTFQNCRSLFMSKQEDYAGLSEEINQFFAAIEEKKSLFDQHLANGDYVDAKEVLVSYKNDVNSLYFLLTNLPRILHLSMHIIPEKVNTMIDRYDQLKSEEYPLSHLRFTTLIQQIKDELATIYMRLHQFQFDQIEIQLGSIETRVQETNKLFDEEIKARREYDTRCNVVNDQAVQLETQFLNRLTRELREISDMYKVDQTLSTIMIDLQAQIDRLNQMRRALDTSIHSKQPFTLRVKRMEDLAQQVILVEQKIDTYRSHYLQIRDSAENAYHRIEQGFQRLKQIELQVRSLRITAVSENFQQALIQGSQLVQQLDRTLKTLPIDNSLMNQQVVAINQILTTLESEIKRIINEAAYAEKLILYGNRYRTSFNDVQRALELSETYFRQGEFNQVIQTLKTALTRFNPPQAEV